MLLQFYPLVDLSFDWYNQNGQYLMSNSFNLQASVPLAHPESCILSDCETSTAEIPFIARYDISDPYWWMFDQPIESFDSSNEMKTNGIIENSESELKLNIYPIPAINKLYVNCLDHRVSKFKILSADGKVLQIINDSGKFQIDITELSSGIYLLFGETDGNVIYKKRWVKM